MRVLSPQMTTAGPSPPDVFLATAASHVTFLDTDDVRLPARSGTCAIAKPKPIGIL